MGSLQTLSAGTPRTHSLSRESPRGMDCPGRTGILQSFSSSRPKTPLLTPAPGAAETRARHPWRILAAPRLQRKPAPLGASDHIAQKSPRGVRPLAAAGAHCSRRTRRGWWGPRLWGHLLGRAGNGRNSSGASRKLDLALRYEFEDGGEILLCPGILLSRKPPLPPQKTGRKRILKWHTIAYSSFFTQ